MERGYYLIKDEYYVLPKQGFNFATRLVKPAGVIEQILDWTKREIPTEWRWQLIETSDRTHNGEYIFYFNDERDYLAFIMKWS